MIKQAVALLLAGVSATEYHNMYGPPIPSVPTYKKPAVKISYPSWLDQKDYNTKVTDDFDFRGFEKSCPKKSDLIPVRSIAKNLKT